MQRPSEEQAVSLQALGMFFVGRGPGAVLTPGKGGV